MGSTNHGSQELTVEYYEEATSFNFNKRNVNIVPRGIYSGGYLTRVSDVEVTLSSFTAEIGDDDIQLSVKTSSAATLNAASLDSGTIDASTPVLVLRWAYVAQQNNYVEVHAIASASAAQDNDIIIGTCQFSAGTLTGFDYSDRTFLDVQDLFLKVEADSGLYVWIRNGRIQRGSEYILIPEQRVGPFSVPSSPNSRIDLVYIDIDGTVSIQQGTRAVSPSAPGYEGKLVVAEVRVVNGDTTIPASRITDVRSFLSFPLEVDDSTIGRNSSGQLILKSGFGAFVSRSNNTVYNESTDGFVIALSNTTAVAGYTDTSNPPTTQMASDAGASGAGTQLNQITMPVPKANYWKVTGATSVYWLPVGN